MLEGKFLACDLFTHHFHKVVLRNLAMISKSYDSNRMIRFSAAIVLLLNLIVANDVMIVFYKERPSLGS